MSKNALICTSLVAAIPSGFLTYLMVQTFLTRTEDMATIMYVIAGLTLAVSALVALTPFGILLFTPAGPKPLKAEKPEKPAKTSKKAAAAGERAAADEEADIEDEELEFEEEDDEYEFEDEDVDEDEEWS